MAVPAPRRQLSTLPPNTPGGMLLMRPGSAGATPITPRWGRTGTRTGRLNGWRRRRVGWGDDAGDVVEGPRA